MHLCDSTLGVQKSTLGPLKVLKEALLLRREDVIREEFGAHGPGRVLHRLLEHLAQVP